MSALLAALGTELWSCNNNGCQGLGSGPGPGTVAMSAGCFFRFQLGSAGIKARSTESQERILEAT